MDSKDLKNLNFPFSLFQSMKYQISALQLLVKFIGSNSSSELLLTYRKELYSRLVALEETINKLQITFEAIMNEVKTIEEERPKKEDPSSDKEVEKNFDLDFEKEEPLFPMQDDLLKEMPEGNLKNFFKDSPDNSHLFQKLKAEDFPLAELLSVDHCPNRSSSRLPLFDQLNCLTPPELLSSQAHAAAQNSNQKKQGQAVSPTTPGAAASPSPVPNNNSKSTNVRKKGAGRKTVNPVMEQNMVKWTREYIVSHQSRLKR